MATPPIYGSILSRTERDERRCEMEGSEELVLRDAISGALHTLAGVAQALWQVREESTDYELCHMLAGVVDGSRAGIIEAMPESWQGDIAQG